MTMEADRQMLLFPDLPLPAELRPTPRLPRPIIPWRRAVQALAALLQLPIRAPLRALERDDLADADDNPTQRIVSAAEAPPVRTIALSSIFGADPAKAVQTLRQCGRFGDAAGFTAPTRVERDGDRVRVVRLAPQETEEYRERETKRRAAQRFKCPPPKPSKKARTRGKKVRKWDGEIDE